jgi:hypothetical protein
MNELKKQNSSLIMPRQMRFKNYPFTYEILSVEN